jgi:para-nitrobenzyl esterase
MTIHHPIVDTAFGPVRGTDDGTAISWKGLRYGAPPVGDLRFRAPEPPPRHTEVFEADTYGPVCPQPPVPNFPLDLGAEQSEDCLVLNVWAPSGTGPGDNKPVMVWLHGGAYVLGSSSQSLYSGRRLASSGDMIVVTLNYRLGVFGFLDLSRVEGRRRFDSNVGLRDVLAALRWVRDNIAGFGGDRSRVTLFGESAGAGIVTTMLAVPQAAGLFTAAIAQSSPVTSVYKKRGQQVADRVLEYLGIAPPEADRLTHTPVPALIAATNKVFDEIPARTPGTLAFTPIVDGELLHDYPVKLAREGKTHPIPLIIGTNKNEAALFRLMRSPLMPITPKAITSMFNEIAAEQPDLQLPTDQQLDTIYRGKARGLNIASDIGFRMPSLWFAEGHSRVAPTYLYRFDYASPLMKLLLVGAAHATELPYVWGTLGAPRDVTLKLGGTKTAIAVSKRIRTRWVNFATDAKPIGALGEPEWTPYQEADRACLIIDRTDRVVYDADALTRPAWGSDVLHFR